MKKLLFAIFLFLPMCIHAEYSITNYRIDVTISNNGDTTVIEAFTMDGTYNGFEKVINYKGNYDGYYGSGLVSIDETKLYNADDVVLNEIRAINYDNATTLNELIDNSYLFSKTNKVSKGDYGLYTISKRYDGNIYKIYNPSKMNKDFYISYTLEDLAISHEDISEVGLRLLNQTNEKINHLEITIHIPQNEQLLKAWVHIIDDFEIENIDNNTIKITMDDISKNDFDIRVIYDKSALETNKKSNEKVFDKILNIEKNYEGQIHQINDEYEKIKKEAYDAVMEVEKTRNREDYEYADDLVRKLKSDEFKTKLLVRLMNIEPKVERKYTFIRIAVTSCMGLIIVGILIVIYRMYMKKERINKSDSNAPYILGYIYRKKINKNDFVASIMNLINDKKIIIEPTKKDFKLIKCSDDFNNVDDKIIKYIFGNKNEIVLSKLKNNKNIYSTWHNLAMTEAMSQNYYEDLLFYKIFGISYAILGIVLSALLLDKPTYFSPIVTIMISCISIIFYTFFYKRTSIGKEKYYHLVNIKHNVINLDNEYTPDDYLMYAIILDCFPKVYKMLLTKDDSKEFECKVNVANILLSMFKNNI